MFAAIVLGVSLLPSACTQDEERPAADCGWVAKYVSAGDPTLAWYGRAGNAGFRVESNATLQPRFGLNEKSQRGFGPEDWSVSFDGTVQLTRTGQYEFSIGEVDSFTIVRKPGTDNCSAGSLPDLPRTLIVGSGNGEVSLHVEYDHSRGPEGNHWGRTEGAQPAQLQLRWKLSGSPQGDFDWEPVPSRVVLVPTEFEPQAREAEFALRGRVLLEQKGCTNCHVATGAVSSAVGRRPAAKLGPDRRLGAAWLAKWIADPARALESPDMPAMKLAAGESQALVDWLGSKGNDASPIASEALTLAQGRALYHRVGCVACHGAIESPFAVLASDFLPHDVPKVAIPAPFGDLGGKWPAKALSDFLRDPRATHTDGRMPSLDLSASDADLIATYLLSRSSPAPAAPAKEAARPAVAARCAACHEIEGVPSQPGSTKSLADLAPGKGCLDPKDTSTPRYSLTSQDRHALELGLRDAKLAKSIHAPIDEAERAFQYFNCSACHARDGRGGVPEELRPYFTSSDERVDIGDEGRIPPDLSGVGFKLTTKWMTDVLTKSGRARPYLNARMPQFGAEHVGFLAQELARREGVMPSSDAKEPEATDERVQTGRALMGRGAHGCISCHSYKDSPSSGTPGPRLDQFAERLRYEWYSAYMPDPARYKPGTRMPAFQRKGKSSVANVLGGDFHAQSDAMWSYFTLGEFMPAPPDIEGASHGLHIAVGDKPIVLRAFLKDVGARAIAVGMPSGLHYAFDANTARLVDAWKGDFVDASGAWAGRGGNELGGLGPIVWKAPAGPAISVAGSDAPKVRFRGYELDAQGQPTFLYSLGTLDVRETIRTSLTPRPRITREIVVEGLRAGDSLLVNSDPERSSVSALQGAKFGASSGSEAGSSRSLSLLGSKVSFTLEVLP